jgi:hypothetical protein
MDIASIRSKFETLANSFENLNKELHQNDTKHNCTCGKNMMNHLQNERHFYINLMEEQTLEFICIVILCIVFIIYIMYFVIDSLFRKHLAKRSFKRSLSFTKRAMKPPSPSVDDHIDTFPNM